MKGKKSLVSLVTVLFFLVGFGFAWPGGHIAGEAADGAVRQSAAGEREEAVEEDGTREAALEFEGDRGTGFSGTCVVNGEERTFEGEVPGRLEFSPEGGRLECKIQKEGPDGLKLTFTAGEDARSVQRINTPGGSKVEVLYEDGNLSTSTLSSGGARSSSQQTIVTGSSRSIVSSSQVVGSFSSTSSR